MYSIIPAEENPVLRLKAKAVTLPLSPSLQKLVADMKVLLAGEEYGVALAAPQVGESLRIFIVSGRSMEKRNPEKYEDEVGEDMPIEDEVYINPTIVKTSRGKKNKHEGCLSIRGKWGEVPRAEKVTLRAFNEHGKEFTRGASGFLAHIFQHEMDHLEGVLYIDKAKELYDEEDSK